MDIDVADVSSVLPGSIATNLPNYGNTQIVCYFEFSTTGRIKCLNIGFKLKSI